MKNTVNILDTRAHPSMSGVETIEYQIPSIDGKTEEIIGWKSAKYTKTVYDSSKISDEEYLRRGMEAANDAASSTNGELGREWSGYDSSGVLWRGYTTDGEVTSFYPDF